MDSLKKIDWGKIRRHYDERVAIHNELLRLFNNNEVNKFVNLLLAVKTPSANYSAHEHGLGPRILLENIKTEEQVVNLAKKLMQINNCLDVPEVIHSAVIRYLGISVGSEIACMLNPKVCWVTNIRTVAADLLIKHGDNIKKVEDELGLYRDGIQDSEASYKKWCIFHKGLNTTMTRLAEMGSAACKDANVEPGELKYLWADCVANGLYDLHFS